MKKKLNTHCIVMLVLMAVELTRVVMDIPMNVKIFKDISSGDLFDGKIDAPAIFALVTTTIIGGFVIYAAIRGFISFVRFIINVNRDKIFVKENIPLLRWTGWGILIYNLFVLPSEMINYSMEHGGHQFMHSLKYAYYRHEDAFILAIFCWIITEVFAIGIKLREEQELTI
ncbi:MAG: DUF2975 domain-containing protein [Bacteroidaceae bacterium]|nr:DUF2975 domain-containing protein [Bacteroidaceae bacterium]